VRLRVADRTRWPRLLRYVQAAAVTTTAFSLLTLFDSLHRLLELFSHFRVQYCAVAAILAATLLLQRKRDWALGMLAVAIVNAALLVPWYLPADRASDDDAPQLTILHANVYGRNEQYQRFVSLVTAEQPDLFFVQEMNAGLETALQTLHAQYPYREVIIRDDNFGIAVYSQLPLDSVVVHESPPYALPSLVVTTHVGSRPLTLMSTHPMPPIGRDEFAGRNEQLQDVGSLINTIPAPFALIGDLNISMWAHHYDLLIKQTGLRNARKGFGVLPSWPVQLPFAMIPIDHCLVSGAIDVVAIRTGPAIGSDHLPLIVTLRIGAD
jgi:endonuclease/exonuclease/phosphatase (EEP) superfamily protein YafD